MKQSHPQNEVKELWLELKNLFLSQNKADPIFKSWLEPISPLKIEETNKGFKLSLKAPSALHKTWLEDHLLKDLSQIQPKISQIHLEVDPLALSSKKSQLPQSLPPARQNVFFNPDYTFENFIVGKNNFLAFEVCQALIKQKKGDREFNPLFIYSPSGLGKTHLLNAIGQEFLKTKPQEKLLYLSAERFLNEYVNAIKARKMEFFRKKYRQNCKLLLMDDIQIITKGQGIQEEFFYTFNELYSQNTQIVVCSDQAPGELSLLEERVKTRLKGGIMVDISYPDTETRLAILKHKAQKKGLSLSTQSAHQIAEKCKGSIREIEGALNTIKIMTELHGGQLSLKEIQQILTKIKKELKAQDILEQTAQAFGLRLEELKSLSRKKNIITARQTAMFLIRHYLKKSLNDIRQLFGKKDHTTVLNALKKVKKLKENNLDYKRILENLEEELKNKV